MQVERTSALFLRLLALVNFIAVFSFCIQYAGLESSQGLEPHVPLLRQYYCASDCQASHLLQTRPSLVWMLPHWAPGLFDPSGDTIVYGLGAVTMAICIVVALSGFACNKFTMLLLYVTYLSYVNISGTFYSFQWDMLLLEADVLAIFLAPWPTLVFPLTARQDAEPIRVLSTFSHRITQSFAIYLIRIVTFKLYFFSGLVKLNDTWVDLSAMKHHYETTCIPNVFSYYMHHLPGWVHEWEVHGTIFVELLVCFGLFGGRIVRAVAGTLMIGLMLVIMLTGNYAFFNLLTIVLILGACLDDKLLNMMIPGCRATTAATKQVSKTEPSLSVSVLHSIGSVLALLCNSLLLCLMILTLLLNVVPFAQHFREDQVPAGWETIPKLYQQVSGFHPVNSYGLFARMTQSRPELIIEFRNESSREQEWQQVEFRFKAGNVDRAPPFVAPHQPRLDWQMWFAALGTYQAQPWIIHLCYRILDHASPSSTAVLDLLDADSVARIRASGNIVLRLRKYDYKYASFHGATGAAAAPLPGYEQGKWWQRRFDSDYIPAVFSPDNESVQQFLRQMGWLLQDDQQQPLAYLGSCNCKEQAGQFLSSSTGAALHQ